MELREYQLDALTRTDQAEARGIRRQLGVAATGLGKTIIFCHLAQRRGGRTLILAHRDELVSQAVAKVREVWPDAQVGIVKAGSDEVRAQVVVASVQTLARPARLRRLVDAYENPSVLLKAPEPFNTVVVDEAHHTAADSYRTILEALRAGQPGCCCGQEHERLATPEEVDAGWELGIHLSPCPMTPAGPLLLGVTATPDRGDGKGLDDLFDEVTWSYDILWGIRAGFLADLRGLRVTLEDLDLSEVKVRRGDYEAGAAGRALEDAGAPDHVVAAWLQHARGRQTLVFTPTVELARLTAMAFTDRGVSAGFVHGGTPLDERRQLLADYAAGLIQVVCNCAVLTEGYDDPRTDCIVVARPTRSRALYTQMVGRGTRRHPDKADCLVLDVVGASSEHSLVTIPSLFGLGEAPQREGMGDGSTLLTDALDAHDREQVRLGRMRAEDAELFARMRREGIAWVAIHRDGELRRYVRQLGRDKDGAYLPTVVLAQRAEGDVWTAGLLMPDRTKRALITRVSMELAQGVAEDYIRKHAPQSRLVDSSAPWRKRKPTPKQLAAARKWKLKDPGKYATAGELSEALDAHIAHRTGARQA